MKKIKITMLFIIVCFSFIFALGNKTNAKTLDTDNLEFKLTRVVQFGDNKYISIDITNNSTTTYSFGWVDSCKLNIETSEGTYTKSISNGKIENGTKTYSYHVDAPGKIVSIYYTDIRELENGLPISNGVGAYVSATIDVVVNEYTIYNGLNIITAVVVGIVVLVLILVLRNKKKNVIGKNSSTFITVGKVLYVVGIILLIYSFFCFVVKPQLGEADFVDVAKKYWLMFVVGMIITAIGQSLMGKGKKNKKHLNYNSFNDDQMRQANENMRLFMEQSQRNHDQAQMDQQNFQNQVDQNNFNNFNNNGMF